ncbi:MAG: DUF177 domain-containing protein [Pseudomonadota bacterium]
MAKRFNTADPMPEDAPLLSRPVNVASLPKKGQRLNLVGDADLRTTLAERFEIDAVETLIGDAEIMPWKRGGVTVKGKVQAELIQPCAVTGDPINTRIDEIVDLTLVPEGSPLAVPEVSDTGELVLDPEGADLPETFASDTIDIGVIWIEHFALGFDPYVRKEGAEFSDIAASLNIEAEGGTDREDSPFAGLAALKKK